ncbi:lysozyme [Methylobrevis pamukkalensis]|uniref:Lysozyme n=1 Tax=Methylobrevis pamukkalensis TaxID=1439726 RepID=A0A1E3H0A3_9HYPH|nr:lysozyme [Methylobrevis pamukkalensis]ODN69585.1 Lysozyme RrrD [Methylobrevis pamukkalensis]
MKVSDRGLAEIAGHEGIVLSPYLDSVGVWTWGVGHTAGAGAPDPATMARGVETSVQAVMRQFRADIGRFEARVNEAIKAPLQQHEFDALVSFDFNTGGIFKAKLTSQLNAGDRVGAAASFMGWLKPPEIKGRRTAERDLFRSGLYANKGTASVYPADAQGRVLWSKGRRVNVLDMIAAVPEATPAPIPPPPDIEPAAPEPVREPPANPSTFANLIAAFFAFFRR